MELFKKTEQFVVDALAKNKNENDIRHAQRTVYWIKQLKPDADEALLMAGVAHDIERAFYGDWKKGSSDPAALRKHQDLSASEIEKFLHSQNASVEMIARVKMLIAQHEEGGDADQNILCDADSLAFFEDKAVRRVKKWKAEGKPKEEIRKNMEYYFSRFISEKAMEIARKWYSESLQELDSD